MQSVGWVIVTRDVDALMIPTAVPISVPAGTKVFITQSLGGTFTVNVDGNLARIEGADADALGLEIPSDTETLTFDVDPKEPLPEALITKVLSTCYDPEIPVNIVDLGLIYDTVISAVDNESGKHVDVVMTLTAPACSMGPVLLHDVEVKLRTLPQVHSVKVELVFDPPWDREMISEAGKLTLGLL